MVMFDFQVKPILLYGVYEKKVQTSWKPWGGIQSETDADREIKRIKNELLELQNEADFPLRIQPLSKTKTAADVENLNCDADAFLGTQLAYRKSTRLSPWSDCCHIMCQ